MFPSLDNALEIFFRQVVDGLEEGRLQRCGWTHEQVDPNGPSRCDLARLEGFHAVVAVEVQEFVALVETHVFYYASAGGAPYFSPFRRVYRAAR